MISNKNSKLAMIAMALGAGMGGNLGGAAVIDSPLLYRHTPTRGGYRGEVGAVAKRKAKKAARKSSRPKARKK